MKDRLSLKLLILIIIVLCSFKANSQLEKDSSKANFLTIQSGLMIDEYNSLGVRTFFEYQKDFKKNWQFGISYEHSRHLGFAATDQTNGLETNLSLLSFNCYYKLNLIKNRLFWTVGLGIGAVHADWEQVNRFETYSEFEQRNVFGATINASITLNIRITKRIYFESSPLIVLAPLNRIYFSTMDADQFNEFYAFTFFPFGIKIKLK